MAYEQREAQTPSISFAERTVSITKTASTRSRHAVKTFWVVNTNQKWSDPILQDGDLHRREQRIRARERQLNYRFGEQDWD